MKKLILLCFVLILFLAYGTQVEAESGVRYPTFTTSDNRLVRTQTAYVPLGSVRDINGVSLDRPHDIHIDQNNVIYIASESASGGKIIIFDMEADAVRVIGESFLINPTGVFARADGPIYVADRGNNIAYKLDRNGDILQTYERPDSPLFGTDAFQPRKIISDSRGNVYILNLGIRGLAQFSNSGEFLGYFGANTIVPTLRTVLQYTFLTDEQRARLFNLTPPEVSNMAIDERGLIHTVSRGADNHGVKRLNINGGNLLPSMHNAHDLVDVFVGPIGNIYVITRSGMIYEYDREGNLLFLFGGRDISNEILGYFHTPSAVAVDRAFNIYVLDYATTVTGQPTTNEAGELKIFYPTEFASLVHTGLTYYQDGNYIASREPWEAVLRMNDFFDLAHRGLGNAYYSIGAYEDARDAYYIANDRDGYSDAFWEVRNMWLLSNVGGVLIALFLGLTLMAVNIKLKFIPIVMRPIKRGIQFTRDKVKVVDDIVYVFTYLKNPADASYYIKRRERVSGFSVTVLLLIYFVFYIYYIYNLNFLFNFRNMNEINMLEEVTKFFLPIFLWVFCNFLIGSIREGEGRLKDVYVTTIYCLAPLFLALPIITIISNGLTYNEMFIVSFMHTISIGVTGIYFFFMIKETHFYTVSETFSSMFISFFTMVMMLLSVFIVYILLNELTVLIKDLWLEVYYRVFDN